MSPRTVYLLVSFLVIVLNIVVSFFWPSVWWSMVVFGPLMLLGLRDVVQKKHAISRNFPVIGHGRFILEAIRPEIMQYFVETNTEGRPLNRINRSSTSNVLMMCICSSCKPYKYVYGYVWIIKSTI